MPNTTQSDFYCLQCGQKGIPLRRKPGQQRGKFHRKKLYCYHCKVEINHIEVRNDSEKNEFLENFAKGMYKDEAKESLSVCGSSRLW